MNFKTVVTELKNDAFSFRQTLNIISKDIINLEKTLLAEKINFNHKFEANKDDNYKELIELDKLKALSSILKIPVAQCFMRKRTLLEWGYCFTAKRYRLFLIEEKSLVSESTKKEWIYSVYRHPFIETKLDVRIKNYKHLIPFMQKLKTSMKKQKDLILNEMSIS